MVICDIPYKINLRRQVIALLGASTEKYYRSIGGMVGKKKPAEVQRRESDRFLFRCKSLYEDNYTER